LLNHCGALVDFRCLQRNSYDGDAVSEASNLAKSGLTTTARPGC
jgi:hypothetical protein